MRARDVMTAPVITVHRETPVREAAAVLTAHGFTGLPVVDADNELLGVVTEADVVRGRVHRDARAEIWSDPEPETPPAPTVGEVMTAPAASVPAGTDAAVLAKLMLDRHLRMVPVVDGSALAGVVTRRDLLRGLCRDDEHIARDVRHRLEIFGGTGRWTVEVRYGRVAISDAFDSPADAHAARVLAYAVPGVEAVDVRSGAEPRLG